ncbi:guided entry of tail-anchored proteins factor 1-like [Liolophura sinensis]|uniref:guided entry of tail-anchored proteins factor 1-like n=1 Tax=Liolophura sinensis TaxID=3198878 RepID=UPI00315872EC
MFLLIFILVLVVVFSYLPQYSPLISKHISKRLFKITDEELNLRTQVKDLKTQQESISVTDHFAKYFKLQRQIDKLLDNVKGKANARLQKTTMVTMAVKISIHIIHILFMLSLILSYRREPLLVMPAQWFTPLAKLIAFPTGIAGGVGVTFWILACNTVVQKGRRLAGV